MKYYLTKIKCFFGLHRWKLLEVIYEGHLNHLRRDVEQCKECDKYSFVTFSEANYHWVRHYFLDRDEYLNRFHKKDKE